MISNANSEAPGIGRRAFIALYSGLLAVGIGQSIQFSVLPPVIRQLALSDMALVLLSSVPSLLWAIMASVWGRVSDSYGRRAVLLLAYGCWSLSTVIFAVTVQIGMANLIGHVAMLSLLVGAQCIAAGLGSGTFACSNAYVADRTSRLERGTAMATLNSAYGLGATMGPVVGSALLLVGFAAPFYLTAGFLGLAAIGVAYFIQEPIPSPEERRRRPPSARISPFDKRVLPLLIAGGACTFTQSAVLACFGFYVMDTLKISPAEGAPFVGIGITARALATLGVQLGVIRYLRPTSRQMLLAGMIAVLGAHLLFMIQGSFVALVLAMVLLGVAFGCVGPATSSASSLVVGRNEQGAVAGMLASANASVYMMGPLVALPLYQIAHIAPFLFDFALVLAVMIFVLRNQSIARAEPEP